MCDGIVSRRSSLYATRNVGAHGDGGEDGEDEIHAEEAVGDIVVVLKVSGHEWASSGQHSHSITDSVEYSRHFSAAVGSGRTLLCLPLA
jgi:hypothetical protein